MGKSGLKQAGVTQETANGEKEIQQGCGDL
jgi:hypothetical protein